MDDSYIDSLMLRCEKPARYSGGEYNQPNMDKPFDVSFCMCFPDVYEVAMSNLGIKILYHLLNDTDGVLCERCFTPWPDFGDMLQSNGIDLFSLERRTPLKNFDMLGFSFQYELSYTNMLYMLSLANIPLRREERDESCPIIVAGGPCMYNPAPIKAFCDVIVVGDGEEVTPKLLEIMKKVSDKTISRAQFFEEAIALNGVICPGYNDDKTVRKSIVRDLDSAYFPTKVLVPNIEAVHDRGMIELFRGCTRGCRFCQAGMIYRPIRERKLNTLLRQAKETCENTGFEELSLSSLSTGDYSKLHDLIKDLSEYTKSKNINLALPSLRLDSFMAEYAMSNRKSSLTFAPEAGTQRLRDVINKNITDEDFEKSLTESFKLGYSSVKLYFMIGLPTETYEDLDGIVEMAKTVKNIYSKVASGKPRITVSCSTFVPKPFTPFQWVAQDDMETIIQKQHYLVAAMKRIKVQFNYHDVKTSIIEALLARGDEKIADVLVSAFKKGAKYDGWNEFFSYEKYAKACEENGVDIREYTGLHEFSKKMAWDNIDIGVAKEFLLREFDRAQNAVVTTDCRESCKGCGMTAFEEGLC